MPSLIQIGPSEEISCHVEQALKDSRRLERKNGQRDNGWVS